LATEHPFLDVHQYLSLSDSACRSSGYSRHYESLPAVLEQVEILEGEEAVLSLTRAWTLVRFVERNMLAKIACSHCSGHFVIDRFDLNNHYVCGLCHLPSRAGKTKKYVKKLRLQVLSDSPAYFWQIFSPLKTK
jgi:Flagellar transcriptional activator (FlhC).